MPRTNELQAACTWLKASGPLAAQGKGAGTKIYTRPTHDPRIKAGSRVAFADEPIGPGNPVREVSYIGATGVCDLVPLPGVRRIFARAFDLELVAGAITSAVGVAA